MNPERPVTHQYYTRSKARAMAEDPAARVERLEKAHMDLHGGYTLIEVLSSYPLKENTAHSQPD